MKPDFPITIFHNPACGTSRNTLAIIEAAGYAPTIVDYLRVGWTRPHLEALLGDMHARPRDILREKGTPAAELGLLVPAVADGQILEAMTRNPILVNRPIVVTPKGVRLCRPSELVIDLLPPQRGEFFKENGERIVDERGRRVASA